MRWTGWAAFLSFLGRRLKWHSRLPPLTDSTGTSAAAIIIHLVKFLTNPMRVPRRSNMFCLSYHCLLCLQIMRTIARVVRQREEGDGPPCSTPNGVGRPRLPVHRAFITLFRGPPPVMFYPPMVAVALNPLRRRRRRLKKVRLVVARGPANSTRRTATTVLASERPSTSN